MTSLTCPLRLALAPFVVVAIGAGSRCASSSDAEAAVKVLLGAQPSAAGVLAPVTS